MKEVRQSLLIGICLSSLSTAQNPPNPLLDPQYFTLINERAQAEQTMEARLQAQLSERQLRDRMNRIAEVWRGFVEEYNTRRTFNIRKAKELSKAFHELESNEPWPRPDHRK